MYSQELVNTLADAAYAAMLDVDRWPRFLTHLAVALGGCSPTLFRQDATNHAGSLDITVDHDPVIAKAYKEHLSRHNVWLRSGAQLLTPGTVRTSHMMCSRRVLLASQWWSDWCRPMGISQGIGATILRTGSLTFNVTVFADDKRPDFGDPDRQFLAALMPHLQRAVRVSVELGNRRVRQGQLGQALDHIPAAVFLVASTARVVYANAAGERMIRTAEGVRVDEHGLAVGSLADTARFRAAVGKAALTSAGHPGSSGGCMQVSRAAGSSPLEILVSPMRLEDAHPLVDQAVAWVQVTDPDAVAARAAEELRRQFALTPAETRVAVMIGRGLATQEIALQLNLSPHTVRTQIKAVLAKTGLSRQAELVRLVSGVGRSAG